MLDMLRLGFIKSSHQIYLSSQKKVSLPPLKTIIDHRISTCLGKDNSIAGCMGVCWSSCSCFQWGVMILSAGLGNELGGFCKTPLVGGA